MAMDFQVKENSDLVTFNCEELDYEEDDTGFKKGSPVAVEQEEGEIISDLEEGDNLENLTCLLFLQGKCDQGSKCPFLHVTDKGLYRMLDSPQSSVVVPSRAVAPITFLDVAPDTNLYIPEPQEETALTDWDQALEEAKKRVQQFDAKTKRAYPATITIESDNDQSCLKLKKRTEFYKLPVSKGLSRDSSTFSGILKQKQLAKENKQPLEITGRRKQRKSSLSSDSRSDSQSPRRCKRFSLSERYNRGNRNRLSSLRSRSPHLSKEQRLKAKSKTKCAIPEKKSRSIGKDKQPVISRRSSRSRSLSLPRQFRKERLKNKSVKNHSSKDRSSVKKRISDLFSKSSDRQPTIACRSLKSRSPVSVPYSREEKLKIPTKLQSVVSEGKSHSVDYKSNRNSKDFTGKRTASLFSNSDKQLKISHPFSPKSHSPPSVCRSEDKKLTIKQSAIPEKKSRCLKNKPEINLRDHDYMKKKISSSIVSLDRQPRDVGRWTPKKIRPPSLVRNGSDMSISPLTDSSLSDLFDPDKKTDRIDKPRRYEATQSRLFPPPKIDKTKAYGPVCPQKIHSATLKSSQMKSCPERMFETKDYMAQNKSLGPDKKTNRISGPHGYEITQSRLCPPQKTGKPEVYGPVCTTEIQSSTLKPSQTKSNLERTIETKNCVTQKKPIGSSTSKQAQKRTLSALESDLLKFHKHRPRIEVSQPAAQQKGTKKRIEKSKAQKKSLQRKPLSRKEELLQQLAKINEVIEKKRKMCAKVDKSLYVTINRFDE